MNHQRRCQNHGFQNLQRRWWFTSFISRMLSQKTPQTPGPQFPSFFSTLSFGIKKIIRLSSENEPPALPWSGCGGGSASSRFTIIYTTFVLQLTCPFIPAVDACITSFRSVVHTVPPEHPEFSRSYVWILSHLLLMRELYFESFSKFEDF